MSEQRQIARRIIDAVIEKHGQEVFLGEGYAPDETLADGIVTALASQPAPSGWQQWIAAMDPLLVAAFHDDEGRAHIGTRCYFCGAESHSPSDVMKHLSVCVWQNAVDALPPAPEVKA